MFVSEIFKTIQGEGQLLGKPSIFFRTSGCNLRCQFQNDQGVTNLCDTPYTSWTVEGTEMSVLECAKEIVHLGVNCDHVVITGGEPFLFAKELEQLCLILKEHNKIITIETNSTIYHNVKADLISMSPKLASSTPVIGTWSEKHKKRRINKKVIHKFLTSHQCQIKFVVSRERDLEEIQQLEQELSLPKTKIILMPEGITPEEISEKETWLVEYCRDNGYTYSDRLHIRIWGNKRGV